jgi:hypothetical protein
LTDDQVRAISARLQQLVTALLTDEDDEGELYTRLLAEYERDIEQSGEGCVIVLAGAVGMLAGVLDIVARERGEPVEQLWQTIMVQIEQRKNGTL